MTTQPFDQAQADRERFGFLVNPDLSYRRIVFDDATFLDRQYTVWGQVESGMEHIDALPKGEPPRNPGKIVKATVN